MAALYDALLAMAVRRVRLLTIVVLVGAVGLIAAHDASWTSIMAAGIAVVMIAAGWVGISLLIRISRNSGGPRGT